LTEYKNTSIFYVIKLKNTVGLEKISKYFRAEIRDRVFGESSGRE